MAILYSAEGEYTGVIKTNGFALNLESHEGHSFLAMEDTLRISFDNTIRPPQEIGMEEGVIQEEPIVIEGWDPRAYALELYCGIINLGFDVTPEDRNFYAEQIGAMIAVNYCADKGFPSSIIVEKIEPSGIVTFINSISINPDQLGSHDTDYSIKLLIPENFVKIERIVYQPYPQQQGYM